LPKTPAPAILVVLVTTLFVAGPVCEEGPVEQPLVTVTPMAMVVAAADMMTPEGTARTRTTPTVTPMGFRTVELRSAWFSNQLRRNVGPSQQRAGRPVKIP
jgi:hypothetical protein